MNTPARHIQKRRERWMWNAASLDQVIAKDMFAEDWDRPSDTPGVEVWYALHIALACLYASDDNRGHILLQRAISYADRLEAEDRFHDTEVAECAYPCSLAEVIQARAYARWLLGEGLDRSAIRRAAQLFVDWCVTKPDDRQRFVSPVTMGFYLEGIRAAAVSGDLDFARTIAGAQRRFTEYHAVERDLWRSLLTTYPHTDQRQFEEFFDRVRDPDFQVMVRGYPTFVRRDWLALDAGIIRQMYLMNASPLDPVDPKAVIEAVAS